MPLTIAAHAHSYSFHPHNQLPPTPQCPVTPLRLCSTEALSANTSSDASRVACDFLRFNAYIAQGQHRLVMDEVGGDSPLSLQGVKLLAQYKGGNRETKEMALLQLKEWLSDANALSDTLYIQSAAALFLHEGDYKAVLKYTHQSQILETMYIVVHTYLAMNRCERERR